MMASPWSMNTLLHWLKNVNWITLMCHLAQSTTGMAAINISMRTIQFLADFTGVIITPSACILICKRLAVWQKYMTSLGIEYHTKIFHDLRGHQMTLLLVHQSAKLG